MLRSLCFAVCVAQIALLVQADGLYSIVGPGTLRSNFKYNVAVSLHKAEGPCTIEVGITGPSFNETKSVELQPMSTKSVEFAVPKLASGDYNLTSRGVSGITFENSSSLNYEAYAPSGYIQTDKATYKPGDLVQFRVLLLDENTLPAKIEKPVTISINDGEKNLIKQIKDVKLEQGVYTGQFQLSEQPVLGYWNIKVTVDDENLVTKNFEVAKYVLPKFEVTLHTDRYVPFAKNVIKVTVRAKYTYGKSVKGRATVSIKPMFHYYGDVPLTPTQKTIDIEGKGHVDFSITDDLGMKSESYMPTLEVTAVVEEELTGVKLNSTALVEVSKQSYKLHAVDSAPSHFTPGKPITYKLAVTNLDDTPVLDSKDKVHLKLESRHNHHVYWGDNVRDQLEDSLEFTNVTDEHGIATFEFTLPDNVSHYFLSATFMDSTSYLSYLSKSTPKDESESSLLTLTVLNKEPKLGKPVKVEVKSQEPLKYFVYTLTARGNIIKTEHVDLDDNQKVYIIEISPSFQMVPSTKIYVHNIQDSKLQFAEADIDFKKEFANHIDISTTAQAKPGEEVELKVATDPGSFVGLLGVDQSVLLLKSGNDFSKDDIFNGLLDYRTNTPFMGGYGQYPGQSSGLITQTNANYDFNHDSHRIHPLYSSLMLADAPIELQAAPGAGSKVAGEMPRIRTEFPESWIFEDIANVDADSLTLAKKIPDTITSWVITGLSLNPKTGLALTEHPSKIQVFQPFFVSTSLPYSVKRGEVIAIPVIVFNYMEKALDAEITLDNTDREFEFTEATNEVEENPLDEVKRTKRVTIPSNTGQSVSFMIRPKNVGTTTLKITAVTPLAGDSIEQKLKVDPEGVKQYQNRAYFVDLSDKSEQKGSFDIDVPTNAVPGSEYIEISVMGDLLAPTIQNIHELVRMPYGCGEQNMVNFVPNILVLKYLKTLGQNMPAITEKAKKYLEIGYQRELTYKHDDGSYSAFGKSDVNGSTWLTAYVARSFNQAASYTDIDPKVIVEALHFLAQKQAKDGSFSEDGKLFDNAHQNELGLTAFVLLAFLENEKSAAPYEKEIAKGIQYLTDKVDQTDDQYSLSIAAVALQRAKSPVAEKVLAKLQTLANNQNGRKWWSKAAKEPESKEQAYWLPRSNDVEITSYVLLALLEKEDASSVLPIIKWLIAQRNSNGGFSSTQDTVVGLQALINFAAKTGAGGGTVDIDFTTSGKPEDHQHLKVSPENWVVLQTHVLPKDTRQVNFTATGKGSSLVQVSYNFNVADKDEKPSFKVTTNVKDAASPKVLNLDVCAELVLLNEGDKKDSNMVVMEVALPSGFTADAESFGKIEEVDRVKRTETKNAESTVIVYFDSLTPGDAKCIPIEATKTHAVAKQKPASVILYDYYEPGRKATDYYEVKSSLCEICEGEDCGAGCKKD